MQIAVAITNHNQHASVRKCIKALLKQSIKPSTIYVLSDDEEFQYEKDDSVICINHGNKGRCANRNAAVPIFLDSEDDAILFIDGDCKPIGYSFVAKYQNLLTENDLVFGTRRHTDVSNLHIPPSDLLTVNMDNLFDGNDLDYRDLRVASGAFGAWRNAGTFDERLDLMLTGMISWSCNFGITKSGLKKLLKFEREIFGSRSLFDASAYKDGWGYEDVAMGIDALHAGLKIGVAEDVEVLHAAHDRTDGLFDHVKGRHSIMERNRVIEKAVRMKNLIYIGAILACAFYTAGIITGLITEYIELFNP